MSRNYSSTAVDTTLSSGVSPANTSITVASTTGFPAAPFILALGAATATRELVLVTAVGGTTLTVTRGYDSTVAATHESGAAVSHSHAAIDFREAGTTKDAYDAHAAATVAHGATGAVVGTTNTQTLTNKTLTEPTLTAPVATGSLAGFGGVWTAYTPTIVGGYTAGSGATLEGWWTQIGKTVIFKARWVLGTGFTIGGGPGLSLPVTASSHSPVGIAPSAMARLHSAGVNVWTAAATLSTTGLTAYVIGTNGQATAISSTVPFTWKATDQLEVAGVYEAA